MQKDVVCAYVKFQEPGPDKDAIPNELKNIFQVLENNYSHNFLSCQVHIVVGQIADMGDLAQVAMGAMHMMKNVLKCPDDHPIMRLALETTNRQYPVVQVAWAYREHLQQEERNKVPELREKSGDQEVMLSSLVVDPYFAVHPKYIDIFSRTLNDDTRLEACVDFDSQLEKNIVEALMSVLAWNGNCSGMGCDDFIFAMYEEWFQPLTPKAVWKIHIANGYVALSPKDILTPLAQVIGMAINTGQNRYINYLRDVTPPGAEEHFDCLYQKIKELSGLVSIQKEMCFQARGAWVDHIYGICSLVLDDDRIEATCYSLACPQGELGTFCVSKIEKVISKEKFRSAVVEIIKEEMTESLWESEIKSLDETIEAC